MGHQEQPAGEIGKKARKPRARFDVQVVRRLIQEKDVRPLENGACKRYPHLPSRGKRRALPRAVIPSKPEARENAVNGLLP